MRTTVIRSLSALARSHSLSRCFSTTHASPAAYGFVGLGRMGYPMARNLRLKLPREDDVIVFDVNENATNAFAEEIGEIGIEGGGRSVKIATGVEEVVEECETIITMLPEPRHVEALFSYILENPPSTPGPEKLFIDSSTIDVSTSLSVSRTIADSPLSATFVDAPVSGGVVGARAGTLAFMIGAPSSLLPRINPILSLMGSRLLHCGPPGSGLAAKLINNYILALSNIAVCEATHLGVRLGLEKDVIKNVVNSSSGRCWSSEVNNPVDTEKRGFEGGFGVGLMRKDIGLALQAAREVEASSTGMGERAWELYKEVEESEGEKDFSVVYRWLEKGPAEVEEGL